MGRKLQIKVPYKHRCENPQQSRSESTLGQIQGLYTVTSEVSQEDDND